MPKYEHTVVGVAAAADDPDAESFVPFAYSVGLELKGWPELLMIGTVRTAVEIINLLSERDTPPAPGPVASPGSDDYVMEPNVSVSSEQQVGHILGGPGPNLNQFAPMPTPDN